MKSPALAIPALAAITLAAAPTSGAAESFDSNGVTISYASEGKGEPVILIHGFLASGWMNWDLPGITSLLAKDFRVIRIDMPGHGRSEKSVDEAAYGTELVEHVARLMDHLDIPKAHLVGYSMGGMITAKFLATHPERALSASLCGMGWLRDGSREQKAFGGGKKGGNPTSICFHSLAKLALTEKELRAISVPTRVIIGENDILKKGYVAPLARVRPDWRVVEIKDADHLSCVFSPQFKSEIAAWLAE